jgi:hypothetical protein
VTGCGAAPGRLRRPGLPLLLLVALAACGGDSPSDPGGEGPRVIKANPTFSTDVMEIFVRTGCTSSGCHGSAALGGLDLRPGTAYTALVGVPGRAEPIQRVIPGNPQGSYLIIRVEGRQTVGTRMPLGGMPLDNIDLTNLRNWIQRGALNN